MQTKVRMTITMEKQIAATLKANCLRHGDVTWHVENALREYFSKKPEVEKPKKEVVKSEKASRFIPPTVQEVVDYCLERGNSIDAQHFVDYYQSNNWMRGKNKIKDWKACVRTWEKNNDRRSNQPSGQGARKLSLAERSAQQTAIIQAKLAAGEFDQCPMGSDGAAIPAQVGLIGGRQDVYSGAEERPIHGELLAMVPEDGEFDR